jgi:hypothetical protein
MRKWIIAVIIGVLLPYPISLLLRYLAQLQADTGNILYGYAASALIFLSYFLLGVFLAALQRLRTTGTERRVLWPEFVLGLLLLLLTAVWKLEQATGLVSAIGFVAASGILTQIVTFNDTLYLWVVMAGYFMTDAFRRVPAEGAAQTTTQSIAQNTAQAAVLTAPVAQAASVRRSDRKKAGKRNALARSAQPVAATPAQPQPAVVQSVMAAQPQPVAVQSVMAAQPQPVAVQGVMAAQPQPVAVQSATAAAPLRPGRPRRRTQAPEPQPAAESVAVTPEDTNPGT